MPNLYFEIEHPDKSNALLSPPYAKTSALDGLVCVFAYHTIPAKKKFNELVDNVPANNCVDSDQQKAHFQHHPSELYIGCAAFDEDVAMGVRDMDNEFKAQANNEVRDFRRMTAELTSAALFKLLGVKTKFPEIRLGAAFHPTLLDIAPSVWNHHYLRVCHPYNLRED
ncbi:hypothetical protein BX600DRAFT_123569 [Xylariales sp. PMI_506]|nr:hypothetical protein BX600DRAFT_123569 [Xylariales sp. PMI_506]